MKNVWCVCQFSNGEYLGFDNDRGFIRVKGLFNAYLGVDGELDDSAYNLSGTDGFNILKCKVGKEKRTILIDNFIK